MAMQPAMFALLRGEPAPEYRAALARAGQAAERQRQREAHGCRLVAMANWRYIVQPGTGQALGGQMAVERRKSGKPRGRLRLRLGQPGLGLLKPGDLAAQGVHQRR